MTQREFSQFVAQYEKLVFTICYQFVKDYHEAQNLSQETFLSAYRHIDNYQGDNYKPWIARIATNKAKDYLNSAYSRRVTLAADEETSVETIASIRQDDPSEQPDEVYISKESSGTIEQMIRSLKEPYREVCPALSGGKGYPGDCTAAGQTKKDGGNPVVPRKSHPAKTNQGGIQL